MNAGLQNQMPFILMDVSYIIFLEMKKFQLGPHMNLYKIGFKKKSVIIREGIEFAAMNRIKTLIIFIYLYKCQELNEAVGVIYILSNKTEISPRFICYRYQIHKGQTM